MLLRLELIDMCFSYLCELTERGLPYLTLFDPLFSLFKNLKVCYAINYSAESNLQAQLCFFFPNFPLTMHSPLMHVAWLFSSSLAGTELAHPSEPS